MALVDQNYREFSLAVHGGALENRVPVLGTLEVTHRCNLNCKHCYCCKPRGSAEVAARELSLEEIRSLLSQLSEAGCLWLLVTGGEPLLRPDFPEIWLSIKRAGLLPILFTNGVLLSERIADLLARYPPFIVDITVYGTRDETHDSITRVPGSRRASLRALSLLLARNVKVALKTIAMTLNAKEVLAIRKLADEKGVDFRFDGLIQKRIDGLPSDVESLRLSPSELVALESQMPEYRSELCRVHSLGSWRPLKHLFFCGAARYAFAINPYGLLSPCILTTAFGVDIRGGSFRKGWGELVEILEIEAPMSPCWSCDTHSVCAMCPGWGLVENGRPTERASFLCEVAKARWSSAEAEASKGTGRSN